MEWISAFPAEAGNHLPISEGWKAELAWEGTVAMSKLSVQDRYVEDIGVVSLTGQIGVHS